MARRLPLLRGDLYRFPVFSPDCDDEGQTGQKSEKTLARSGEMSSLLEHPTLRATLQRLVLNVSAFEMMPCGTAEGESHDQRHCGDFPPSANRRKRSLFRSPPLL